MVRQRQRSLVKDFAIDYTALVGAETANLSCCDEYFMLGQAKYFLDSATVVCLSFGSLNISLNFVAKKESGVT